MNHNAFQWVEIASLIGAGGCMGWVGLGGAGQDRGSGDGMS